MSQQNVEIVRRGYDAVARGDFEALFEILDPGIEMRDAANSPDVEVYRGHQGVFDFLAKQASVFDDFHLLPERFVAVEDEVVVLHRQVGRSRRTGLRLEARYAHVWILRDKQAIRGRTYESWDAALEAVGLRD